MNKICAVNCKKKQVRKKSFSHNFNMFSYLACFSGKYTVPVKPQEPHTTGG